jgi:putative transcriptional regulator
VKGVPLTDADGTVREWIGANKDIHDVVSAQAELAERLGVSRQTVNAIETEKYEPSLTLAFKIARLFEKMLEEIFEPELD